MRLVIPGTALAAALCNIGCTTTSGGQPTVATSSNAAAKENTALIRFVNADQGAKSLEMLVGGVPTFTDLAYKTLTPYVELPPGYTMFTLRAKGASDELANTRIELFPGRHYTLVALAQKKGLGKLVSLSDSLGPISSHEARVRLINATTDIDDLDLFKEHTNTRIAHGVDAGTATSFTDIEPGSVEVHRANQSTPMKLSMLPVIAEHLYTFIVVGPADNLDAVQVDDHVEP